MILLSDANIFLDLEYIGLLEDVMALPDIICTEYMLFRDEIRRPPNLRSRLNSLGLRIVQATDEEFALSLQIQTQVRQLSPYDCIMYAVAKTRNYTLITSDKKLRQTSQSAGIETHGLLFLIDKCIESGVPEDHITTALHEIIRNPRILIPSQIVINKYGKYLV